MLVYFVLIIGLNIVSTKKKKTFSDRQLIQIYLVYNIIVNKCFSSNRIEVADFFVKNTDLFYTMRAVSLAITSGHPVLGDF